MLDVIFNDLRLLQGTDGQEGGGIQTIIQFKGALHNVIFKIPVAFVIGDCEGNDRLCGRYKSHNSKFLCRDCDCLSEFGDNPNQRCFPTTQALIQTKSNNAKDLSDFCHYNVDNAFHKLWFGGDNDGIHGCSPPETLHLLQQGLHKYALSAFFEVLNAHNTVIFEKAAYAMSIQCKRQSDRTFPRITLKKGASNISYMTAREQTGMLLVCFLTLCSDTCVFVADTALKKRLFDFRTLFKDLLLLEYWIESEFHSREFVRDNTRCLAFIKLFMQSYKDAVNRQKGNGLKIPKFHQLLHVPRYILKFGSPKNFNSGRCESHHITLSKRPAKTAQKRDSVYESQVASRIYERMLITRSMLSVKNQNFGDTTRSFNSRTTLPVLRGSPFHVIRVEENNIVEYQAHAAVNPHKKRLPEPTQEQSPGTARCLPYKQDMLNSVGPKFFSSQLLPTQITFFSELMMDDPDNKDCCASMLFRAHPQFGATAEGWFDWAYINWKDGADSKNSTTSSSSSSDSLSESLIPGRFCLFADLRNISPNDMLFADDGDDCNFADGPGIYAVVESFKGQPVPGHSVPSPPLQIGNLDTTPNGNPRYWFCHISAIQRPAFVLQLCRRMRPMEYHVLLSPSEW